MRVRIKYLSFLSVFTFCFFSFTIKELKIKNNGYYKLATYSTNTKGDNDSTVVSGNIFDLKTQEVLPSSSVTLKDMNIGTLVDNCGHFAKKIKAGTYTFVFNRVGNTELTTKTIVIKPNHNYHFIVYLDSYSLHDKSK